MAMPNNIIWQCHNSCIKHTELQSRICVAFACTVLLKVYCFYETPDKKKRKSKIKMACQKQSVVL